jgi:CheY-like chemotaxis protein
VEKKVIISDRQGTNRINPKSLPIIKQRMHRMKKFNTAPLALSRCEGHKGQIMVVDDDEGMRHLLSIALSGMGYDVVTAGRGAEALNLLLKSPFALVITDLEMPGMDGWNLASRIKDRFPGTPVILMTGCEKEDVMKRMKRSSVDDVIFKPFRLEDILKTAEKMLSAEPSEKTHQLH